MQTWSVTAEKLEAMKNSDFIRDLCIELIKAQAGHLPMNSLHESYAVILEELDEAWDEIKLKAAKQNRENIRKELIQVAAMAWRSCIDNDLEIVRHG